MKITLSSEPLARLKSDFLAIAVFEGGLANSPAVAALDGAHGLGGQLQRLAAAERFEGKAGQVLDVPTLGRTGVGRVLLLGLGKAESAGADELRRAAGTASKRARAHRVNALVFTVPQNRQVTGSIEGDVGVATEGLLLGHYRFDKYLSEGDSKRPPVEEARIAGALADGARPARVHLDAIDHAVALCGGVTLARDLVNEPAEHIFPASFADLAADVARKKKLTAQIFDLKKLEKAGMGMIIGVGRGSAHEPRLVHLSYRPAGRAAGAKKGDKDKARHPFFVGKGITFDSGGLSIKPADGMMTMKCDMSGAAAVLGLMNTIQELAPPFPVDALMALAENMPSGTATRPGDVLRSYSGKTVEVLNTDAEGRLVLGDALGYAVKQGATEIIDLATLTGACMVALGDYTAGLFSNDDAMAERLRTAGKWAGEDLWRLPLTAALRDKLKSEVADMKNIGDRWGGAITAALFLKEFIGDTPWAHLDIAGPAFLEKELPLHPRGATGFGVRTLARYLALP